MSVINALSQMHREAVEQIRAGDHNAFLVGFLTTSTMLELASLTNTDMRIDEYATAAAETITQYAPIDRVRLRLEPDDLPPIVASVASARRPTATTPAATRASTTSRSPPGSRSRALAP
ncbi:MAG: hypothetical protein NTZ21_15115 [Actinobacteria bacterium]|nr:hypothetical protein [Actinomycetota bacterium]